MGVLALLYTMIVIKKPDFVLLMATETQPRPVGGG
jgi:hypothetical protein